MDGNAWWGKLKPVGAGQHLLVGPRSGQQFSLENFSSYVKSMFKKHTGVAVNAHLLRDVVVTELLDRQAPMALRGAYAVSMGQSLETQIQIYDKRNQVQQIEPALEDMQQQFALWSQGRSQGQAGTSAQAAGASDDSSNGAALVGVKRGRSKGASAPGVGGEFTVEKVLEAKANKRGKLVEALVAWSPTWESARNLNEVTTAEAYALLGFK